MQAASMRSSTSPGPGPGPAAATSSAPGAGRVLASARIVRGGAVAVIATEYRPGTSRGPVRGGLPAAE